MKPNRSRIPIVGSQITSTTEKVAVARDTHHDLVLTPALCNSEGGASGLLVEANQSLKTVYISQELPFGVVSSAVALAGVRDIGSGIPAWSWGI